MWCSRSVDGAYITKRDLERVAYAVGITAIQRNDENHRDFQKSSWIVSQQRVLRRIRVEIDFVEESEMISNK